MPEQIKAELKKYGFSQADIALEMGVRPASVHCVIFKGAVSARIRKAIADKIGKSVTDIWPGSGNCNQEAAEAVNAAGQTG